MTIKKLFITQGMLLLSVLGFSQTVSTVSELQGALDEATAGTVITIADGIYSGGDFDIEANGTSSNPVVIQAENRGNVIFDDCRIKMGGSYITLTGVIFSGTYGFGTKGASSYAISFKNSSECSNCKVTQIKIDSYNPTSSPSSNDFRWIRVYGQDNEISYSTFTGKNSIGSIIFNQREDGIEDRMKIHHNYFANREQVGTADSANDLDVMRIGDSNQSLSSSNSEVYDNYFYKANGGEPEAISNKSGGNKYYNNTFEEYLGALSLRHGNECEVYNNFFLNLGKNESYFNGGIRVEGEDHKIYNNYISGTNSRKEGSSSTAGSLGAINVSAGQSDSNFVLNGYGIVKRAIIVNNTIVDCDLGLRIGPDSGGANQSVAPEDITVANNLFVNNEEYIEVDREATGSTIYAGNMYEGNGSEITGFTSYTGLLDSSKNVNGIYPLIESSAAVNGAEGSYGQTLFFTDVFGDDRIGTYDVGAQEYGAVMTKVPYNQSDVGVVVGFMASEGAILSSSEGMLNFPGLGGELTFEIKTEATTTWNIEGLPNWATSSTVTGMGNSTVTIIADDNSEGDLRNATLIITGDNGAEAETVLLNQTNEAFATEEITIISATAKGTQVGKSNVDPSFAWDNAVSANEYWSGNAATEAEVSIIFDLTCNHTLTELGIHFLSANERTTNFDVSVAIDGSEVFINVFTNRESLIESGAEEVEQLFSLENNVARYVKITGNGNSTGTDINNWVSIAQVNIYGDIACKEDVTLSVNANSLKSKGVILYPVPVINNELTIESSDLSINEIFIYNINGEEVLFEDGNGSNVKSINTSNLVPGVYFLVLEEIGSVKFIID